MARIRTVKPALFEHEVLFDAEHDTGLPLRLAFIGLFTQCDREGRFLWRPRQLGVNILPYDEIDFSRVLDALWTRGFVVKYASNGNVFGYIPSWSKHQVINNRESDSQIPDPESEGIVFIQQADACPTREARVPHARKVEGKGREYGKEGNGKGKESHASKDAFEIFWKGYPRKKETRKALNAFLSALKRSSASEILAGVGKYAAECRGKEPQFIKHAASWLNADCWGDEPDKATVIAFRPGVPKPGFKPEPPKIDNKAWRAQRAEIKAEKQRETSDSGC
jgi:hypothetical protein